MAASIDENGNYVETTPPPVNSSPQSYDENMWGFADTTDFDYWLNKAYDAYWYNKYYSPYINLFDDDGNLGEWADDADAQEWWGASASERSTLTQMAKDLAALQAASNYYNLQTSEGRANYEKMQKIFQQKYGMQYNQAQNYLSNKQKEYESQIRDYTTARTNRKSATEEQTKLERETRESGLAEREAAAKQAQTQARSQGQSRGLASSLGNAPLSGYSAENYGSNYGSLANLGQSTQNDYLQKMGYVNALQQNADNVKNSANRIISGSAIEGVGMGAQVGSSLFGGGWGGSSK